MFQKMKNKVRSAAVAVKAKMESKKAENYVDSGVKS